MLNSTLKKIKSRKIRKTYTERSKNRKIRKQYIERDKNMEKL